MYLLIGIEYTKQELVDRGYFKDNHAVLIVWYAGHGLQLEQLVQRYALLVKGGAVVGHDQFGQRRGDVGQGAGRLDLLVKLDDVVVKGSECLPVLGTCLKSMIFCM